MALWMEAGSDPVTESEMADLDAIAALKDSAARELKVSSRNPLFPSHPGYNSTTSFCCSLSILSSASSLLGKRASFFRFIYLFVLLFAQTDGKILPLISRLPCGSGSSLRSLCYWILILKIFFFFFPLLLFFTQSDQE